MELSEIILAHGHNNVQATHKSTFEITKDSQLSKKGDCIIGVSADKSVEDLNSEVKENLRKEDVRIMMLIEAGENVEVINAYGNPRLILAHPTDIVVRKSSYICNRTLAIKADKAAQDLSRELVKKLRNPEQEVKITLTVKV